jgi:hypothetical protein
MKRYLAVLCVSAGCGDSASDAGVRDAGGRDAAITRDASTRPDSSVDAPVDSGVALDAAFDAGSSRDVFGVAQLYPSADSPSEWTSAHWDGMSYEIDDRIDPRDPAALSGIRGTGTLEVEDGVLVMSGSQPRLYVYPPDADGWTNVEVTVYMRRVTDGDVAFAGIVIGARSGSDGHTTDMACDAHTYYARLRNDGRADFAKELEHPEAAVRATTGDLWPDDAFPHDRWIGWKHVIFNRGGAVTLESYRDLAEGADGGEWELVARTEDDGSWTATTTCPRYAPAGSESTYTQLEGGAILVRNTEVERAEYRWVSVREIAPP